MEEKKLTKEEFREAMLKEQARKKRDKVKQEDAYFAHRSFKIGAINAINRKRSYK